jgi:hypothetical protein
VKTKLKYLLQKNCVGMETSYFLRAGEKRRAFRNSTDSTEVKEYLDRLRDYELFKQ